MCKEIEPPSHALSLELPTIAWRVVRRHGRGYCRQEQGVLDLGIDSIVERGSEASTCGACARMARRRTSRRWKPSSVEL